MRITVGCEPSLETKLHVCSVHIHVDREETGQDGVTILVHRSEQNTTD